MSSAIREMLERQEHAILHPLAAFSDTSQGRARPERPCPVRPAFQRDRDRILHCKSFRRLLHKTQVFLSPQGDHYRTRLTHTLEVSQIARTLSRGLRLNEYLTEAIALGHDLGHTPFGHAGEAVLNRLMPGGFRHEIQSVRVVVKLENNGQGLNLSREVIDGIGGHSKGRGKIISGAASLPRTLEGQLVRVSDIIAYVNHDLDDALRSGVLRLRDIPARLLEEALKNMRSFLWDQVYENPKVHGEFEKCDKLLSDLFEYFQRDEEVFTLLSEQKLPQRSPQRERIICDFLAGMTDRFAVRVYEMLSIPRPWPVNLGCG
jgi:dGTPase